jgi:undecaprenyl diphosphate synthase
MQLDMAKLPKHVGIIMDGNRRWAKKQGLSIIGGHKYVTDNLVELLIERCGELNIPYLTLWAFSTENWNRDKQEVSGVLNLFRTALKTKVARFIERGAQLRMIGDMSRFPADIQEGMKQATEASKHNSKIIVTFALNYGGRDEIVRAVQRMTGSGAEITEKSFENYLDTAGMPDPDLIIRTGGDQRLSGFLTWQSVYSELYFTETLMPDFTPEKLNEALADYQARQRRFGR